MYSLICGDENILFIPSIVPFNPANVQLLHWLSVVYIMNFKLLDLAKRGNANKRIVVNINNFSVNIFLIIYPLLSFIIFFQGG